MNFVHSFADENNIEFKCIHIDAVGESKKHSMGVEEYSRKRRYEFFDSLNADKIATAHTLSDNIETVLFRISRGTSTKGLCGIPAVRGNIIRPLINCTREDIETYCKDNSISFVTDSTNLEDDYSRNFIRHNIVPQFKALNGNFENAFLRLVENVNLENSLLDSYAVEILKSALESDEKLNIGLMNDVDEAVYKRVVHKYFNTVFGIYLDDYHISSVYDICLNGGKTQINENKIVVSNKSLLRIASKVKNIDFSSVIIDKLVIDCEEFVNSKAKYQKEFDFCCDYDKINGNVFVRSRKPSDKIRLQKRHISKSLKKYFNELSILSEMRESVPVLCDDIGLIGIVGYDSDERVCIKPNTKKVLLIKLR